MCVRAGAHACMCVRVCVSHLLLKPGEGPSESVQKDGSFAMEFFAENEHTGEQARVRVAGLGDPGYSATAVMLAESALCLALDEGRKGMREGIGMMDVGASASDVI